MTFAFFATLVFLAIVLFLGYMALTPAMLYKFRTHRDFGLIGAECIPMIMVTWRDETNLQMADFDPAEDNIKQLYIESTRRLWEEFRRNCTFCWNGLYSADRINAPSVFCGMPQTKALAFAIAYADKVGVAREAMGITDEIVGRKLFNLCFRSAFNLANGLNFNAEVRRRDFLRYDKITKLLGINSSSLLIGRTKSMYVSIIA